MTARGGRLETWPEWPAILEALRTESALRVAERFGVSRKTIGEALKRTGLRVERERPERASLALLRTVEHRLGVETDEALGEELGLSFQTVGKYRRALGIPSQAVERGTSVPRLEDMPEWGEMLAALPTSTVREVSRRFGWHQGTLARALRRTGVEVRDPDGLERTRYPEVRARLRGVRHRLGVEPDVALAAELGVQERTVQQYRQLLRIDPYDGHYRRPTTPRERSAPWGTLRATWRVDWEPHAHLLGTRTDREVAEIVGCTHGAASAERRRRRIRMFGWRRPGLAAAEVPVPAPTHSPFDAELRANHLRLGLVPDSELAAEIGCSAAVVHARRTELGIAPCFTMGHAAEGRDRSGFGEGGTAPPGPDPWERVDLEVGASEHLVEVLEDALGDAAGEDLWDRVWAAIVDPDEAEVPPVRDAAVARHLLRAVAESWLGQPGVVPDADVEAVVGVYVDAATTSAEVPATGPGTPLVVRAHGGRIAPADALVAAVREVEALAGYGTVRRALLLAPPSAPAALGRALVGAGKQYVHPLPAGADRRALAGVRLVERRRKRSVRTFATNVDPAQLDDADVIRAFEARWPLRDEGPADDLEGELEALPVALLDRRDRLLARLARLGPEIEALEEAREEAEEEVGALREALAAGARRPEGWRRTTVAHQAEEAALLAGIERDLARARDDHARALADLERADAGRRVLAADPAQDQALAPFRLTRALLDAVRRAR